MMLFRENVPFYRANLHAHTTNSDGQRSPEECLVMYRAEGYDIVALTDHRKVTMPTEVPAGLLHLPGIELDYTMPNMVCHILGIGVTAEAADIPCGTQTPQPGIDALRANGAQVILAHPAWSLNTTEFICNLKGVAASEVWNSISAPPYNASRADSSSLLDVASANGQLLPLVASDDVHFYGHDFAVGWTMIQAEELTVPAVKEAIAAGRFYATQGPAFRQVEFADGHVRIECSPVETIIFYSNTAWVGGRTRIGEGQTGSDYKVEPGDTFVRCEIIDAQGRRAWTSPIAVK